MIYTLLPAQLENQDLEIALKEYINVWEKNSGISVVYRTHGQKVDLPEVVEQSIFRITQEALSKHRPSQQSHGHQCYSGLPADGHSASDQ